MQGLDGTIYLDFCGVGPYQSRRPGSMTFFDPESGAKTREKQIKLTHSDRWEANPSTQRLDTQSSRPYLGSNLYAADRVKAPIPYKPNTQ